MDGLLVIMVRFFIIPSEIYKKGVERMKFMKFMPFVVFIISVSSFQAVEMMKIPHSFSQKERLALQEQPAQPVLPGLII